MLQPTSVFGTNWNRIVIMVGTRFHLAPCFTRRIEAPQANLTHCIQARLSLQASSVPIEKCLVLLGLQNDLSLPNGKLLVKTINQGFCDRTKALVKDFRGHGDAISVCTEIDASKEATGFVQDGCNIITSLVQRGLFEVNNEEKSSRSEAAKPSKKGKPETSKSMGHVTPSDARREQQLASYGDNAASTSVPAAVDQKHFRTHTLNKDACSIKGTDGADFAAQVKSPALPTDLYVTGSYYSAFCSTSLLSILRPRLVTELYLCGANTNLNVNATSVDAARYSIKVTPMTDCLA